MKKQRKSHLISLLSMKALVSLQKNIADIFTRYTILSNHEGAGTGIGLSLSYELIKLHKGNIIVASTPGKGTTFTITLLKGNQRFITTTEAETDKMADHEEHPDHVMELSEYSYEDESDTTDLSDEKMILVVEDNQEILNYICQSLKSFFMCIGARNGKEGLHIAKTLNPDVIITDIMMPEMDGMEMTRILKEDFNTSHIPVIMLTSKSELAIR